MMTKKIYTHDQALQFISTQVRHILTRAARARALLILCDDRTAAATLTICNRLVTEFETIAKMRTLPPVFDEWFAMCDRVNAADAGKPYPEIWHGLTDEGLKVDDEDWEEALADEWPYSAKWHYHSWLGSKEHRPLDVEAYVHDLIAIADTLIAASAASAAGGNEGVVPTTGNPSGPDDDARDGGPAPMRTEPIPPRPPPDEEAGP
jgi:hypothetical protein